MSLVLVVDDDPITRETIKSYLEDEGFSVISAEDGHDLDSVLAQNPVDIIFLDVRMPGKDGLTLTRELRAKSEIGIILVTNKSDRLDRIVGLEMGADDHIAKPADPRELVARARNLLRRLKSQRTDTLDRAYVWDNWTLYMERGRLFYNNEEHIKLTKAEFDLLTTFVSKPGRTLSRDFLLQTIPHRKENANSRTVDTLVRRLRKIIEKHPERPSYIVTVHGSGYIFSGDVVEQSGLTPPQ
ncbi:response regulator [Terasakiella sp. A23]|uniref:response regulator n=1 Tax=Terasakiella sp. FCG-A23 TaxID=3080561 RepID=UPI00295525AD|nr:response regulator [Terasakiella sp. A23]MDV7341254.1 response regulator [Terasakiella sp. A23]